MIIRIALHVLSGLGAYALVLDGHPVAGIVIGSAVSYALGAWAMAAAGAHE